MTTLKLKKEKLFCFAYLMYLYDLDIYLVYICIVYFKLFTKYIGMVTESGTFYFAKHHFNYRLSFVYALIVL